MKTDFVVINIGRNVANGPMPTPEWLRFQTEIRNVISGQAVGQGAGSSQYNGAKEKFATFHFLVDSDQHYTNRGLLARLARLHNQDSIAYMISTPDSLVPAAQPLDAYL